VVDIEEAERIYRAAKHPKSYISLDKADHLLSKSADADYVAQTLTAWASRYLDLDQSETAEPDRPEVKNGEVLITERDAKFLRGLFTADHQLLADEPKASGGGNQGPNPYDLLLMSLGACTSMTLRMYANHKELPIENIQVRLRHQRIHAKDCEDCEHKSGTIDKIEREISYEGDLSTEQNQRLLEIADRCPVHKTLAGTLEVTTQMV